jgi:ABC-type antimicrobial peptide transport system permease subunit
MSAAMLGIFAALALLLAAVGIYGVMSFSVAQRSREIGIRMALGAEPGEVVGLVLRQGMTIVAIGIAVGLFAAFAVSRLAAKLLFGVSPNDPLTFAVTVLVLALVALVATLIPARRAITVDPVLVLKGE